MSKRFKMQAATSVLEKETQKRYQRDLERVVRLPQLPEELRGSLRELVDVLQQENELYIQRSYNKMNKGIESATQIEEKTDDEFYTVEEVAHLFRISRAAVYKWIQNTKIDFVAPPVQGGKGYLIPKAQFEGKLLNKKKAEETHKQIFGENADIDYVDRSDLFRS